MLISILLVIIGITLYAGVSHLLAGMRRQRRWLHLSFAGMCFLVVGYTLCSVSIRIAPSVSAYVFSLKVLLGVAFLWHIVFVWFVSLYTGVHFVRLLLIHNSVCVLLFLLNLLAPYSLALSSVEGLTTRILPWGEEVVGLKATASSHLLLVDLPILLSFPLAYACCVAQFRNGQRSASVALLLAISLEAGAGLLDILMDLRILKFVSLDVLGFLGFIIVMTLRLAYEMEEAERQLRSLTGRLISAQEQERQHIARELHDDLNQNLALIAVELDLLQQGNHENINETKRDLQQLAGKVQELSADVHHLSHRLHPAKLQRLGLVAAVRGHCQELGQQNNIAIQFEHSNVPKDLPSDIALNLFRIVQEALQNAVRHGHTSEIQVRITLTDSILFLVVTDTGVGFNPTVSSKQAKGIGLVSIHERVRLINGQLRIDSRSGKGTKLSVSVPIGPERN